MLCSSQPWCCAQPCKQVEQMQEAHRDLTSLQRGAEYVTSGNKELLPQAHSVRTGLQ